MALEVATEINRQLGHQARMMMGVKQRPTADETSLTLKMGRGAAGSAQYLKITLTPDDLYTIETIRVRKFVPTVVAKEKGLYVDMMHAAIERMTGFRLSMTRTYN